MPTRDGVPFAAKCNSAFTDGARYFFSTSRLRPLAKELKAGMAEIGVPVRTNRDRLAVDQSALGSQTANRLRDLRQSVGEIRAVAGMKPTGGVRRERPGEIRHNM